MSARPIRFVVHRYGSEVVGGSESLIRRIAHALAQRGWDAEVFTTTAGADEATWTPGYPAGTSQDGPVRVRRFGLSGRRHPRAFHQMSRAFFRTPARLRPEALWIRAQGPVAPGLVGALATAEPRPTVFTPYLYHPIVCGLPTARGTRVLIPAAHDERPLRLRAVGRAVAATDGLWFGSAEERDLLVRVHPVAASKPHVVGTVAIEAPEQPGAEAFKKRHGLGSYLLFGGRAAAGKGLDQLVEDFAALRRDRDDIDLVLIGDARDQPARAGVRNLGRVSDEERWAAIAGATAVVVPSVMESLSLLALEGWAMGRPALLNSASAVLAGQAERSGGGLVYRDAAEFATAAARLTDDAAEATRLGERGREFVRAGYRWDAVVERLEQLITAAGGEVTS